MLLNRLPWRRWLGSWAIFALLFGFVPLLIGPVYYAIEKPSDFDPALKLLRADGLVWAVRVGSLSYSSPGIGVYSSSFGLNAGNPGFEQGRNGVWKGTLHGTYQATYLAWFRSAHHPDIFTVFRNVKPNGEASFGTLRNGSKPISDYLLYSVLLSAGAVVFFEIVGLLERWKKTRVMT